MTGALSASSLKKRSPWSMRSSRIRPPSEDRDRSYCLCSHQPVKFCMPEQEQVSRGKVFGCDVETRCPCRHRINYGPSQLPPAKGVPKLGMILLPALRDPWGLDDPVPSVPSVHVQTSNGSPPIRPVATPPPLRLNARCRFGQETFAGIRGNGRDAPKPVPPANPLLSGVRA
jgi:hypothetical protein